MSSLGSHAGMNSRFHSWILFLALLPGCAELRARSHARKGNHFYTEGNYAAALAEYSQAEELLPSLPVILLNKGLACRQLMSPGAKSATNDKYVECALSSFDKLKHVNPSDARADQLYVQTLFDADRYETLAARYQSQLASDPNNLAALNGLIQVYSRSDRWDDTLKATIRRAEIQSRDAEAQYSVGVLIWNHLFQKGGNAEKAAFNPLAEPKQIPPPFGEGDVVGAERAALADRGIEFLQKALAIRPQYREAMTYLNLLFRQKSYAFFDQPESWQAAMNSAAEWQRRSLELDAQHKAAGH